MKQFTFNLTGRPISKKNSKRVMRNRYTGKPVVLSSSAFMRFETDCNEQIMLLRNRRELPPTPITGNLRVHTKFFVKGRYDLDADNAHTSILDILQGANVIENDKLVVSGSYEKLPGCEQWGTVITIETL